MLKIDDLMPLLQIRPEANALEVARMLGATRGAEHLQMQIREGLVGLPFQSTPLMVAVLELAARDVESTALPREIGNLLQTNLALKMDMDVHGDVEAAVAKWIRALSPPRAPFAGSSHRPPLRLRTSLDEPDRTPESISPLETRPAFSLAGFQGWVRQPLTLAFLAGFMAVGLYRGLGFHSEADLSLQPPTQEAAMFPGATENQSFDPNLQPAPPLPPPATPGSDEAPQLSPPAASAGPRPSAPPS